MQNENQLENIMGVDAAMDDISPELENIDMQIIEVNNLNNLNTNLLEIIEVTTGSISNVQRKVLNRLDIWKRKQLLVFNEMDQQLSDELDQIQKWFESLVNILLKMIRSIKKFREIQQFNGFEDYFVQSINGYFHHYIEQLRKLAMRSFIIEKQPQQIIKKEVK